VWGAIVRAAGAKLGDSISRRIHRVEARVELIESSPVAPALRGMSFCA
jgi:hypothetical protein